MSPDEQAIRETYARLVKDGTGVSPEYNMLNVRQTGLLLGEIQRLREENIAVTLTWIPPELARKAVHDAQRTVADRIAALFENQVAYRIMPGSRGTETIANFIRRTVGEVLR